MTATENVKAVKPGKPAHEMPTKHMINADGTLSKFSLAKLDKPLSAFADTAREMEAQLLTATCNANVISPTLVQRLAVVKCQVEAESAALALYKENNQEEDTASIIKVAMEKLNEARPQFKLIRKMIKAMEQSPIPAEHNVDPAPLDG